MVDLPEAGSQVSHTVAPEVSRASQRRTRESLGGCQVTLGLDAINRSPANALGSLRKGRVDPVHLGPQLASHDLDLVAGLLLTQTLEVFLASLVLGDPLAGEGPILDVAEDLLHGLAGGLADHALAPGQVAVLSRVG